jgi:methyl-accepting chemotaxis protein
MTNPATALDVFAAVESHQKWKIRRLNHINKKGEEDLDWRVVCRDDACPLGKWLHTTTPPEAKRGLFTSLMEDHTEFHMVAGEIVSMADSGNDAEAKASLQSGDFAKVSRKIFRALAQLHLDIREFQ